MPQTFQIRLSLAPETVKILRRINKVESTQAYNRMRDVLAEYIQQIPILPFPSEYRRLARSLVDFLGQVAARIVDANPDLTPLRRSIIRDSANFKAVRQSSLDRCFSRVDLMTLEPMTVDDKPIFFFVVGSGTVRRKAFCTPLNFLRKEISITSALANWVARSGQSLDSEGNGGGPGLQRYVRISTGYSSYFIVDESSLPPLFEVRSRTDVFLLIPWESVRIGNTKGQFGIGMRHGQLPAEQIYRIQPVLLQSRMYEVLFESGEPKGPLPFNNYPTLYRQNTAYISINSAKFKLTSLK